MERRFLRVIASMLPTCISWVLLLFVPAEGVAQARIIPHEQTEAMKITSFRDTMEIRDRINRATEAVSSDPDSALILLNQALNDAVQSDYTVGILSALQNISYAYAEKKMYSKSLATLRQALSYCNRSGNTLVFLPRIYGGIGSVFQLQNNYEAAARYYYQAILFAEQFPRERQTGIARIYNNMAELFNLFGISRQAEEYLDRAEILAMNEHDLYLLESILINRGIVYLDHGQLDRGEKYFQNALGLAEKYNLTKLKHISLLNLAGLYIDKNQAPKALYYIHEILARPGVDPVTRNGAVMSQGQALLRLGRFREAEDTLLIALAAAGKLHSQRQKRVTSAALADLYAATGRYQQAFRYYRQYAEMKDSITNQQIADNVNRLEMKYRVAQKDKELYQKQLLIDRQERRIERKNILIAGITAGTLALTTLLFSLYRNRRHARQIWQLKAMMKGEEKERNRIGRELHDGIGGMLTAINMNLGAIQKRHQQLPQMKELDVVTSMLQDMAAEIRKTSHNLMPDILLRHGFPETLRMYCDQVNSGNGVQIDLQCYGGLDGLDRSLAFSLYRILQELIQNIIKHAHAGQAVIQIRPHEERLIISVEDDGCGFDPRQKYEGAGLQNIRSRVQALYGHISVESEAVRGTTIYIELPHKK